MDLNQRLADVCARLGERHMQRKALVGQLARLDQEVAELEREAEAIHAARAHVRAAKEPGP